MGKDTTTSGKQGTGKSGPAGVAKNARRTRKARSSRVAVNVREGGSKTLAAPTSNSEG